MAKYIRKTTDEYQLHVNYGQGWEHETSHDTYKDAKDEKKLYRETCPWYPVKIVKKRVKINTEEASTNG